MSWPPTAHLAIRPEVVIVALYYRGNVVDAYRRADVAIGGGSLRLPARWGFPITADELVLRHADGSALRFPLKP